MSHCLFVQRQAYHKDRYIARRHTNFLPAGDVDTGQRLHELFMLVVRMQVPCRHSDELSCPYSPLYPARGESWLDIRGAFAHLVLHVTVNLDR